MLNAPGGSPVNELIECLESEAEILSAQYNRPFQTQAGSLFHLAKHALRPIRSEEQGRGGSSRKKTVFDSGEDRFGGAQIEDEPHAGASERNFRGSRIDQAFGQQDGGTIMSAEVRILVQPVMQLMRDGYSLEQGEQTQ